jgi:ligand-binding sensor domain-containing protein
VDVSNQIVTTKWDASAHAFRSYTSADTGHASPIPCGWDAVSKTLKFDHSPSPETPRIAKWNLGFNQLYNFPALVVTLDGNLDFVSMVQGYWSSAIAYNGDDLFFEDSRTPWPTNDWLTKCDLSYNTEWRYDTIPGYSIRTIRIDGSQNVIFTNFASSIGSKNLYKINADGTFAWDFTSNTNELRALAIDASNNIYIAHKRADNCNVRKLSPAGSPIWTYDSGYSAFEPLDMVADASGNLWIACKGDASHYDNVWHINSSGSYVWSTILSPPSGANARAITRDSSGNVWVGEDSSGGRIFMLNPTTGAIINEYDLGSYQIYRLRWSGSYLYVLHLVGVLKVDSSGNIVASYSRNTVSWDFDVDGDGNNYLACYYA